MPQNTFQKRSLTKVNINDDASTGVEMCVS